MIDQQTVNQCKMRNAEAFVKANYVLELFDCPQADLNQKIQEGTAYFSRIQITRYLEIATHAHKAREDEIQRLE